MDKIIINDLEVFANHGVYPEENALGQKFIVSAVIGCDLSKAARSDSLDDSVNYAHICATIINTMKRATVKLIEAAAQNVCNELFLHFEKIRSIDITIEKPWAPIGAHLRSAAVRLCRARHRVFLSIGSNMGDREGYLKKCIDEIRANRLCHINKISEIIETKPYGGVEQNDFLNACVEMQTQLEPYELLEFAHRLEKVAGRERTVHWGPRTLDVDILLYDDLIMNEPDLIIPHCDMQNRGFVLKPMCEIAPFVYHPRLCKSMKELYDELGE